MFSNNKRIHLSVYIYINKLVNKSNCKTTLINLFLLIVIQRVYIKSYIQFKEISLIGRATVLHTEG